MVHLATVCGAAAFRALEASVGATRHPVVPEQQQAFRFGDGKPSKATEKGRVPIPGLGRLEVHLVSNRVPCLMGRESLKALKAQHAYGGAEEFLATKKAKIPLVEGPSGHAILGLS